MTTVIAKISHWFKYKELHSVANKDFFKQILLGLIIFSTVFTVLHANHSCPMAKFIHHDILFRYTVKAFVGMWGSDPMM